METPDKMSLPPPINMDFEIHARWRGRWILYGTRRSSRVRAKFITRWSSQTRQSVVQIEDKRGRRKSAERDCWIATLKPPESIAAHKQAGGHFVGGDAALAPGECEVTTQFAQRIGGRQRNGNNVRDMPVASYLSDAKSSSVCPV